MLKVFVSSPFGEPFDTLFETIAGVARQAGLLSYRVDQDHVAAPLAEVIEREIRESHIVLADITANNSNVLNEIGQAQALGKPLIIISQDAPEDAPFNIRGLRIHRYDKDRIQSFRKLLERGLSEATSPNELLRTMLVPASLGRPTRKSRFVVAVRHLTYRRVMGRAGGYKALRRTSSDYVGVRGILQTFGLLYGFETLPDIMDPDDCDDCVISKRMNIYCIASPKANRWTGKLLRQFSKTRVPQLEFKADPESKNLQNIKVSLYSDGDLLRPPGWLLNVDGDRYRKDFGLIVRAPNPYSDDQMVTIMAGRSSLGSEATCAAVTDVALIEDLRQGLAGLKIDLEDHKQAFWALASMKRAIGDGKEEAIADSLKLHQFGALRIT